MSTPFFTALSGLSANMRSLSVIGHNLANMNTVGFKSNLVSFQDLVARGGLSFNAAGNPLQVGLGVSTASVTTNFSQGGLQRTDQPLDAALVGAGFFIVDGGQQQVYTRAGNFALDADGNLVTQQGHPVLGFPEVGGTIDRASGIRPLSIELGSTLAARATGVLQFTTNLDSTLAPGEMYSTNVQVVDALGGTHTLTFEYTRDAPAAPGDPPSFSFDVLIDGGDVVGGTAGTPFSLLAGADQAAPPGNLVFDGAGALQSVDTGAGPVAPPADFDIVTPGFTNGAAGQAFTVDLVDDAGASRLTAFASPSTISATYQDGSSSANLITFSIDAEGIIQGIYTNGESAPLGQLAVATFTNPVGLVRLGENLFGGSASSGEASIGAATEGQRGSITGGALELSNVDIAQEFTKLIVSQRGYQANSRMITTTDEVTQETINLKR